MFRSRGGIILVCSSLFVISTMGIAVLFLLCSTLVSSCLASFKITSKVESNFIDGNDRKTSYDDSYGSDYKGPFRKMFVNGDMNVEHHDGDDPGQPLFLTPFIEAGKLDEARSLARVKIGHRYGHSFSGFLTVNKKYNSNLFFWFFPARADTQIAPVVVWLQGGPGGSSLFGLFAENGPFYIDKDLNLLHRNYSWNYALSVLYIDNPVGTGFSFTENDEGYARNEADVGKDLYSAITQFFQLFPGLSNNDLYITGESYAGKYVPALAYTIHKNNPKAEKKINLRGMAIGDGLCDPVSMTDYGDFLYQIGLLDESGRAYFKQQGQLVIKYIQQKEWKLAFKVFDELLNGDTTDAKSYFYNVTGLSDYYNFLLQEEPKDLNYWGKYINQAKVRKEIHVGNLTFNDGTKVEAFLVEDIMKSVKPWIEEILKAEIYKVLIYNGQLDVIIASPLTNNFINGLDFQYADRLKNATRHVWKVDGMVAGYVKEVPNFAQILIRDAGHMVPYDQPKWAYDMITRFTLGKGFV